VVFGFHIREVEYMVRQRVPVSASVLLIRHISNLNIVHPFPKGDSEKFTILDEDSRVPSSQITDRYRYDGQRVREVTVSWSQQSRETKIKCELRPTSLLIIIEFPNGINYVKMLLLHLEKKICPPLLSIL
jgi:hypothetical protein